MLVVKSLSQLKIVSTHQEDNKGFGARLEISKRKIINKLDSKNLTDALDNILILPSLMKQTVATWNTAGLNNISRFLGLTEIVVRVGHNICKEDALNSGIKCNCTTNDHSLHWSTETLKTHSFYEITKKCHNFWMSRWNLNFMYF